MLMLLVPKQPFEEGFRTQFPLSVLQGKTEHGDHQSDLKWFHPESNILTSTHIAVAKATHMVMPSFKGLEKFTPPICSLEKENQEY